MCQRTSETAAWPGGLARRVLGSLGVLAWGLAACSDGTGPNSPGIHALSGASGVDSIQAILREPLAVVVVDESGRRIAGQAVSFTVAPAGSASLAREGDSPLAQHLADTTDESGRAAVQVRLGTVAGSASVIVRVTPLGFFDTAQYTVTPGAAARIALTPRDTVVYPGTSYTLRAVVTDRFGNARSGDATTVSVALGPGEVDATRGMVTTKDFGRARMDVRSGSLMDTAWVSVVPAAWVAAQQHDPGNGGPIGIFLMQLDGSGRTLFARGLDNAFVSGQGFGWSPDGQLLAIARGDSVDLAAPGTLEERIIGGSGALLSGARFSRDGQWIYFARAGKGIFRVHPDGTGEEHLGYGGTEWGEDFFPTPSADGSAVAYGSSRSPCGQTYCIRVLDLATGAERTLISGNLAAWSPVGDVIAYVSGTEIGLIHADGTGQRVLGTTVGHVGWMDWSPDGRWLLASPGVGPVLLFDTTNGSRLPLATLVPYGATAWRPRGALASSR
jgi:hypothetical protein